MSPFHKTVNMEHPFKHRLGGSTDTAFVTCRNWGVLGRLGVTALSNGEPRKVFGATDPPEGWTPQGRLEWGAVRGGYVAASSHWLMGTGALGDPWGLGTGACVPLANSTGPVIHAA